MKELCDELSSFTNQDRTVLWIRLRRRWRLRWKLADLMPESCWTMLSPESANFVPIRQHDPDDDGIQEPSDVMELDTMSSALDFEVFPGIDSIDNRLRQSNMSALSRYKVSHVSLGAYLITTERSAKGQLTPWYLLSQYEVSLARSR